mgnify:CR=1 FL=1
MHWIFIKLSGLGVESMAKRMVLTILLSMVAVYVIGMNIAYINDRKMQTVVEEDGRMIYHILVEGTSMMPTIADGDVLIADGTVEAIDSIYHGDIVSIIEPDVHTENRFLIKRVVGMAGDVIEIKYGKLYVNGFYKNYGGVYRYDYGPYTVEADSVFVLGDNNVNSLDSRRFRNPSVPMSEIVGKIMLEE